MLEIQNLDNLGTMGSPIETPHLDNLDAGGLAYSKMYTAALYSLAACTRLLAETIILTTWSALQKVQLAIQTIMALYLLSTIISKFEEKQIKEEIF